MRPPRTDPNQTSVTPCAAELKVSQRPARQRASLEAMPGAVPSAIPSVPPTRSQTRQRGIALVAVLLAAMVLMVSLLAISATMTISSQRTTADQGATLQAQYAAEAGLAYAKTRTAEAFVLLPLLTVPVNTQMRTLERDVEAFCGKSGNYINRGTLSSPQPFCRANDTNSTPPKSRDYSVFTKYISSADITKKIAESDSNDRSVPSAYLGGYNNLSGAQRTVFWKDMFSGGTPRSSVAAPSQIAGAQASFTPDYGFVPDHADAIPGGFRLFFKPATVRSAANLKAGSDVVAARELRAEPAVEMFSIDISRRCFCEYNYYANRRLIVAQDSRGRKVTTPLVFGDKEKFYGKVHINSSKTGQGAPLFYATYTPNGKGWYDFFYAHFYGGFSTAAAQREWSSNIDFNRYITYEEMFGDDYKFGADKVIMPDNALSQRRAVIGGDPENSTPVSSSNLAAAYGYSGAALTPGVYYGEDDVKGNGSNVKKSDSWLSSDPGSGIYVQGNVSDLRLTTDPQTKKQVITITQIPCVSPKTTPACVPGTAGITQATTTTFSQKTGGDWVMSEQVGSSSPKNTTIKNGKFNGLVFVDGSIGSDQTQIGGDTNSKGGLGGEGTGDSAVSRNIVDGKDVNKSREKETPDIAKDIRLTVTARDDIYIKRNLTYSEDPKADDPTTPGVDESTYNMLGIYSEKGNIKVDGVKDKPIKIDGSFMALGETPNDKTDSTDYGKGFGSVGYNETARFSSGKPKPTIELTGGVIEEQSQGVGVVGGSSTGYDRDFDYDRRFADGQTPPFFPTQGQFTSACYEVSSASANSSLPMPDTTKACTRNNEDIWVVQGGS